MKQTYVTDYTTRPVPLGRQGENEVTQIIIPVADVLQEFGDTGSFVLAVKRSGDTLIYPPGRFTWDDENVTWTLTATDTEKSGIGCFGLRYTIGDKVKWSQIWTSFVEPTLDMDATSQPDVYTSFLEELSERTAELHRDIDGTEQMIQEAVAEATASAAASAAAAAESAASIELPLPISSGGTGQTTAAGAVAALGLGAMSVESVYNDEEVDTFDIAFSPGTYLVTIDNLTESAFVARSPGLYLLGYYDASNISALKEICNCEGISVSVRAQTATDITVRFAKSVDYGYGNKAYYNTRVTILKLF